MVVFLAVAASRWLQAGAFDFNSDETWSMWIATGSPGEIARQVAPQWTPLYTELLAVWQRLTGIHPTVVRYSSVLTSILGVAFAYRAAYRLGRLHRRRAALLVALAYAALGFAIYLGSQTRAYPLSLALIPLLVWLALRYFDCPSLARAAALAACLVFIYFVNLTSAVAFVAVGALTLFVYGRRVWRWWLPGVIAAVPALPLVLEILSRPNAPALKARDNPPPPFLEAMHHLYRDYAGDLFVVWVVLFAVAGWLLWRRGRHIMVVGLLVWVVALPVTMYIFNKQLGLFTPRYQWWVMFGIALWVGWGLAHLPQWGQWAAAGFLIVSMFVVIPYEHYSFQHLIPLRRNFELLARHYQAGDVILRDTNCLKGGCRADYEWQYFVQAYFPDGLVFVEDPGEYRRIWYVKQDGWQDDTLEAQIAQGRVRSTFFGPWDFLFQLYEAPPDPGGVPFDNGMRFHGVQFPGVSQPYVWHEGETVRVRLWWSVDEPVADDYSVGVYMLYEGRLVDQADGPPQTIDLFPASTAPPPQAVSRWEPGRYYVEERELVVPNPKRTDIYPLYMAVYQWWDGARIAAPSASDDGLYFLANVNIKAW